MSQAKVDRAHMESSSEFSDGVAPGVGSRGVWFTGASAGAGLGWSSEANWMGAKRGSMLKNYYDKALLTQ